MWWYFTVSKIDVREDNSKWADVFVTEVIAPEYDNQNIRKIEDWLYDIPNAGTLWDGYTLTIVQRQSINQVEYKILN